VTDKTDKHGSSKHHVNSRKRTKKKEMKYRTKEELIEEKKKMKV
jgi:hypothetical protein